MFVEEMVDTLIGTGRDGFTMTKDASYILYLFKRGRKHEVRLVHKFVDKFDRKENDIYLENYFIPKGEDVRTSILEMLNERGLLMGGHTK
jgi:hypothetical protein